MIAPREEVQVSNLRLIWPASLHHVCLMSEQIPAMAEWYGAVMGLQRRDAGDGKLWLAGNGRNILLTPGPGGQVAYAAFRLQSTEHINIMRDQVTNAGIEVGKADSPLFEAGAISISDPDGNRLVMGLAKKLDLLETVLPGRLQHIVRATTRLDEIMAFYENVLGVRISDRVIEDPDTLTASFFRTDEEHHSMAFFRAPKSGLDHFSCEADCWNDIRDWGDHFGEHRVPITWGAGRHGVGNNLFIFVADPDGNNIEISTELNRLSYEDEAGQWPHEERSLNLWGSAWMRS